MQRSLILLAGAVIGVVAIVLAVRELGDKPGVDEGRERGPAVGGARTTIVRIRDLEFDPENVSLVAGQTVRWVNADDTEHTVTSDPGAEAEFDSGELAPGDTFDQSFSDAGTFPYHCEIHPEMRAKVTVLGD